MSENLNWSKPQYCNHCRKETNTLIGDCSECGMSKPTMTSETDRDGILFVEGDCQLMNEIDKLTAENLRLRSALEGMLHLCEEHGDFSNGNTDEYGTIDEGNVMAASFINEAREALK